MGNTLLSHGDALGGIPPLQPVAPRHHLIGVTTVSTVYFDVTHEASDTFTITNKAFYENWKTSTKMPTVFRNSLILTQ